MNNIKNKKGALELSVNTIIIIVIGVTLLTLGLLFVRGIFGKVTEISDKTFNKANDLLSGLENVNSLLTTIPTQVEVEQGKDDVVKIILANFGENDLNVGMKITPRASDNKLKCFLYDERNAEPTQTSGPYTISSGNQRSVILIVKDENGKIRTTACNIEVTGAPPGEDNTETIIIRVTAKEKAFG